MMRPVGVTVLAVIATIYGIFRLLLVLLAVAGLALAAAGMASKYSTGELAYALVSDLILGVLFLAFGIGALQVKAWAWTAGVVALALEVVGEIVSLVRNFHIVPIIIIVIVLLVLVYLSRPNVRAAFGRTA